MMYHRNGACYIQGILKKFPHINILKKSGKSVKVGGGGAAGCHVNSQQGKPVDTADSVRELL
jgi:hypothetical protein